MENIEERLLQYSEIEKFYTYFQNISLEDTSKYYSNYKFIASNLNEISLRRAVFDFNLLIFCKFKDTEIENFIIYELPESNGNKAYLNILAMTIYDFDFITKSNEYMKKELLYRGWTKIELILLKLQITNYIQVMLNKCMFNKEVEIKSYNDNMNTIQFSLIF